MAVPASAATFTVTNGADDPLDPAEGTFRWAMQQAEATPGHDTITIAPGVHIVLEDKISFTESVSIIGDEPDSTSITMSDMDKLYNANTIPSEEIFELRNTAINGTLNLYNIGKITIDNAVVESPDHGYTLTASKVSIINSTFRGYRGQITDSSDNNCDTEPSIRIADSDFSADGEGWHVYNVCAVHITGSHFHDVAYAALLIRGGGPVQVSDSSFTNSGRGLQVEYSPSLLIERSEFANNGSQNQWLNSALKADYINGPITVIDSVFTNNYGELGGGISVAANFSLNSSLRVVGSVFSGNTGDRGGAIWMTNASQYRADSSELAPLVSVSDTLFSGNTADKGGAIYIGDVLDYVNMNASDSSLPPALVVERSTFTGNTAPGGGTSIWIGEGMVTPEMLFTIDSSTFSETAGGSLIGTAPCASTFYACNSWLSQFAITHSTLVGGGVVFHDYADAVEASIGHTVIDSGPFDALAINGGGTAVVDSAFSVFTQPGVLVAGTGGSVASAEQIALGALADNGGLTPTMLPLAGSILIDGGDPAFTPGPATDQRGQTRISGTTIDIGAVEVETMSEPIGTPPTITTPSLPGATTTQYSQTVEASGDGPITFTLTTGSLPPGLTLDPTTGTITGTPTRGGDFTFTITATNDYGSDTHQYTITVPAVTTTTPDPTEPPTDDPTEPPVEPPNDLLPPTGLNTTTLWIAAIATTLLLAGTGLYAATRKTRT